MEPLKILDLNGQEIIVTDLKAAIEPTKTFVGFRHVDQSFSQLDIGLNAYWKDVYKRLLALKATN